MELEEGFFHWIAVLVGPVCRFHVSLGQGVGFSVQRSGFRIHLRVYYVEKGTC